MQRLAVSYGPDFDAGLYSNSRLDFAVNISPHNHPALIPARAVSSWVAETGAQAVGATQPAAGGMPSIARGTIYGAGSTLWAQLGTSASPFGATTQAGDTLSWTTASGTYQVVMRLAGTLGAGMGAEAGMGLVAGNIRGGAVAAIVVDGTTVQTLDTYGAQPELTLYLDGTAHTIAIQHTGGYNGAYSPLGPVVAGAGTGTVAHNLLPTMRLHPTCMAASWRVKATGSTAYSLYRTLPGGSETLVTSGLVTGTHYPGTQVAGVDLYVSTGTPLVTNDDATFTTDVVMLTVESITHGTGVGSGASTWTSPVYDFGDAQTRLVVAEMQQSVPLMSALCTSGQTPTPDGTWTSADVPLAATMTSDGAQWGTLGLGAVPAGRYGQVVLTLAGVSTAQPWLRDLVLYAWNPARDAVGQRLVLHARQMLGPHLAAYLAALATWYADVRADLRDLRAAGNIGGASDGYLADYLADYLRQEGLGWVTGEPKEAARARARGVLANAAGALSIVGIAQQVNLLVDAVSAPCTVTGVPGALVATCGRTVVEQAAGVHWYYLVAIPSAPYPGLPGLPVSPSTTAGTANALIAQYVFQTLRPVGSLADVSFVTGS